MTEIEKVKSRLKSEIERVSLESYMEGKFNCLKAMKDAFLMSPDCFFTRDNLLSFLESLMKQHKNTGV